ncbi:rubrerythrin family protein [Legionella clemsonensis]|uniref:DUF2383 domain-containing protein n=1 Tax=Legionella clemsonensis TaxID=1867846 RepID=A0A222P1C3_9GAMM|nr:rubrerythrin family protein [Legionella clemsonensis]ASQ45629.1 hypothetical protein clem_05365 [Legionella clemsonensis]
MATMVGTQEKFEDALYGLCELDFEIVEAYKTAINRLDNATYKHRLTEFKNDHQCYIKEISNLLKKHNKIAPTGPGAKKLLTQGKVVFADLFGDEAILKVLLFNEKDVKTAFERLNCHETKWRDAANVLKRGLGNERRHQHWFEAMLEQ